MAESKPKKVPRRRKSPETVREHAEKQARKKAPKKSRIRSLAAKPARVVKKTASKEYNPVKVPQNNKVGKVLGKRVNLVPKFLKNSWAELKLVTWPSRKNAIKLTFAVFVFAIAFSAFVQVFDLIFNRLVKIILIK